jgi:hypothetical protein
MRITLFLGEAVGSCRISSNESPRRNSVGGHRHSPMSSAAAPGNPPWGAALSGESVRTLCCLRGPRRDQTCRNSMGRAFPSSPTDLSAASAVAEAALTGPWYRLDHWLTQVEMSATDGIEDRGRLWTCPSAP